jgi:hypothetical protein
MQSIRPSRAAITIVAVALALSACSGAGVRAGRLRASSFKYGYIRNCDHTVNSIQWEACAREPDNQVSWWGSKMTGMTIAALLGRTSHSTTGREHQTGLAGDLFLDVFVGSRGLAFGLRGGFVFHTAGDGVVDGYTGWALHPQVFYVPIERVALYGGPGLVFGDVKWGSTNAEMSRGANAFRVLGGLRVELFDLGKVSSALVAELSYLRTGAGSDGPGFSGNAINFGSLVTF